MKRKGKANEYYTCWHCLLEDFLKAIKGYDDINCTCHKEDEKKILVFKDNMGRYQFTQGRVGRARKLKKFMVSAI